MSYASPSSLRRIGVLMGMSVLIAAGLSSLGAGPALAQNQQCWTSEPSTEAGYPQWPDPPQTVIDPDKAYVASIDTNRGDIVVELAASEAPDTVNNFVCLARAGFYEVTVFHRIIANFMIQGGDPTGTGTGGPGYQFEDELPEGETPYVRGTVAMANAGENTNGSQFFIVQADQPAGFTPNYSIFGRVTEGLDVLDAISQAPVGPNPQSGEPSEPQVTLGIRSITIEEDGQPMDALQGDNPSAATIASPTVDSATAANEVATEAVPSTVAPESTAEDDDESGSMTLIAGGVGIVALAALGYGFYRRSRATNRPTAATDNEN
ncbi:MAG: peptidylprolyl isomerase [Thermomicrobiales bacterium]